MESGHVLVVIIGVLTHNTTIISKDFLDNFPIKFKNNLFLGIMQWKYAGAPSLIHQSEASATNINVFSAAMDLAVMVQITSTAQCTEGNVVIWSKATWAFTGSVEEVHNEYNCGAPHYSHLYQVAEGFRSWSDCMALCPRVQEGGRVPLTLTLADTNHLTKLYRHPNRTDMFWASFKYESEGHFVDHYKETPMPPVLWEKGQPNEGSTQQCTQWDGNTSQGKLFDVPCIYSSEHLLCLCQFAETPILRLRGLCKASKIDTHYTIKSVNGRISFLGLTGTVISFVPNSFIAKWLLTVNLMNTKATSLAEESSLLLGKYMLSVDDDSAKCHGGGPYTRELKMSGCSAGEFTCNNGDCVTMEERCDQVLNCADKTDEVNWNWKRATGRLHRQ